MGIYIRVDNGVPSDRTHDFPDDDPPILASVKKMVWFKYIKEPAPNYDVRTHKLAPAQKVISGDTVTESRAVEALTQQEIDDRDNGEIDHFMRLMKPVVLALNDGTFVPGSNYTNTQMRAIIKAHR